MANLQKVAHTLKMSKEEWLELRPKGIDGLKIRYKATLYFKKLESL